MSSKPDIVIKLPSFSKNKSDNKIEIHKNFNSQEQLKTKMNKNKSGKNKKTIKKIIKITAKHGSKMKKGGSLFSNIRTRVGSLFNYTKKAKEIEVTPKNNDSYTYVFDKVSTINNNKETPIDGVKIYKNDEHVKDVILEKNYIPSLFSTFRQRFSRKSPSADSSDKLKSTKKSFIDSIRNSTFIVKENSTFYKYLEMATKNIKEHKRVYAVLAFILISVLILFVPFTGVMLFTLVPFAYTYLITGASVIVYDGVGAISSEVISPMVNGFNSTIVTGSENALADITNEATYKIT